jgi:hypothetical protein
MTEMQMVAALQDLIMEYEAQCGCGRSCQKCRTAEQLLLHDDPRSRIRPRTDWRQMGLGG